MNFSNPCGQENNRDTLSSAAGRYIRARKARRWSRAKVEWENPAQTGSMIAVENREAI